MASKLVSTAILMMVTLLTINAHFCHGRQKRELSTPFPRVVVEGSVFCDTCAHHSLSHSSFFISGATIAVECLLNMKSGTSIRVEGETDESGLFNIEIPSIFHSRLVRGRCSAQLIRSPQGSCNIPSIAMSTKITLTSHLDGVRTYSAGSLSYRPENVPSACFMEESDSGSPYNYYARGRVTLEADETSKATVSLPSLPSIPGLPTFNFPQLPPLGIPTPPVPNLSVPPLPGIPPLPKFSFPPLPTVTIPNPPPFAFNFPPIPFLTPPPPSK